MKSITDYFPSPTGSTDEIIPDSTDTKYECSLEKSTASPRSPKPDVSETVTETNENMGAPTEKKKKKRKKKYRKPSDPVVRNIAQLLSTSLHLVSPEKNESSDLKRSPSLQNNNKILGPISVVKIKESKSEQNSPEQISGKNDKTEDDKTKINAFQFMMDSRNKSIGTNSPGKKVLEDSGVDSKQNKEELAVRKNILSQWAEQKGASKRKREEALDETINHKLNKRARRLKALLNVENITDDDSEVVLKKGSKRMARILSSSGSDSDFESKVVKEKSNERKKKKNSLVNLEKSIEEVGCRKSLLIAEKVIEENLDSVPISSKPKESRQSILSFLESSSNSQKNFQDRNIKQLEQVESVEKSSKEVEIINHDLQSDNEVQLVNEKSKKLSSKSKSKTKKNKKKSVIDSCMDESSQETISSTPRRLRSWKIKINLSDQIESNQTDKTEKSPPSIDESSNDDSIKDTINISSDDDYCRKKKSKKPVKVAPIFAKSAPKPKVDPKVIEARKQFLMSGIPSSLKKVIEKEQSVVEKEIVVFPTISHIQQKCSNILWNLPIPDLELKNTSPLKIGDTISECRFENLTRSSASATHKLNIQTEVEKIDKLKLLLNKIKQDNPNYPVHKSYRIISEQCGKNLCEPEERKTTPKRGRGKKKAEKSAQTEIENNNAEFSMWTEKYKARCSDDIIGNTEAVKSLKNWLVTWMNFSREINSRKKRNNSESEFETDGDSRDSMGLPGNTVVLGGPCGSGKSTAVYAICSELGFNVIELNASSKRTGKRLLQKIQEATQSHQVRKGEPHNFFEKPPKTDSDPTANPNRKMVAILIEDIDIVFDQDDGFVSALTQLISSSKRPIVLTTTDYESASVQKILGQYEYIDFLPLAASSLSPWLQILCLVEGLYVDRDDLGALLEGNKGDVRKTLLEVQFWAGSGGQGRKELPKDNGAVSLHRNCAKSFEILEFHRPFAVPFRLNLGKIWWSLPEVLGVPKEAAHERRTLESAVILGDLLSFADVALTKANCLGDGEPVARHRRGCWPRDGLELGEDFRLVDEAADFAQELAHNLVDRCLRGVEGVRCGLDLSAPGRTERRWRAKRHLCETAFQGAIPLSNHLERKSLSLDYMPALRYISRTEADKEAKNTKRGNRFRSYLRDLGMNRNGDVARLACDILRDPKVEA